MNHLHRRHKKFTTSHLNGFVPREVFARVGLTDINGVYLLVLFDKSLNQGFTVVSGTIINYNPLKILECLFAYTLKNAMNVLFTIKYWCKYCKERLCLSGFQCLHTHHIMVPAFSSVSISSKLRPFLASMKDIL